jgi:hypothetical protein
VPRVEIFQLLEGHEKINLRLMPATPHAQGDRINQSLRSHDIRANELCQRESLELRGDRGMHDALFVASESSMLAREPDRRSTL